MGLATELADYLSGLTVTQGRLTGQPFPVFPWQRRFISGAFADGVGDASLIPNPPKGRGYADRGRDEGRDNWMVQL